MCDKISSYLTGFNNILYCNHVPLSMFIADVRLTIPINCSLAPTLHALSGRPMHTLLNPEGYAEKYIKGKNKYIKLSRLPH